jgi:hypothetical protein
MAIFKDIDASDVYLSAQEVYDVLANADLARVEVRFQVPLDEVACTVRTAWGPRIYFRTYGTSLDILAHELAHALEEDWDEPTHGVEFRMLAKLAELALREYL